MVFVLIFDQLLKFWTATRLPEMHTASPYYPYGGVGLFQDFFGVQGAVVHATNTGAAWSLFSGHTLPLLVVRMILLATLAYLYVKEKSTLGKFSIALIAAGAAGNILDVFFYGHVIDMFYFIFWGYSYPVFNIADSAICIGVILYLISSWLPENDPKTAVK